MGGIEKNKIENLESHPDIDSRVRDILSKRETLYTSYKTGIHDRVAKFCHKLFEKYGSGCQTYAMYEALVHGDKKQRWDGYPKDKIDFIEEEDSIQKFVDKALTIENIRAIKKRLYGDEDLDKVDNCILAIRNFIKGLESKYPVHQYASFHIVSGSSGDKDFYDFPSDKIDFPGEDSIEKFIEKLEEKNGEQPGGP